MEITTTCLGIAMMFVPIALLFVVCAAAMLRMMVIGFIAAVTERNIVNVVVHLGILSMLVGYVLLIIGTW